MAARHASELELLRFDDEFEGDIRLNEPMARHTTYRIGGPAHAYAQVNSIAALATVLKVCADEELSWFVSGKGSNLLVSDEGYPGVVIALAGEFRAWQFDEEEGTVVVGAGTMLSRLVQEAFHHGFSGMEFAVGTPGTVGGALLEIGLARASFRLPRSMQNAASVAISLLSFPGDIVPRRFLPMK